MSEVDHVAGEHPPFALIAHGEEEVVSALDVEERVVALVPQPRGDLVEVGGVRQIDGADRVDDVERAGRSDGRIVRQDERATRGVAPGQERHRPALEVPDPSFEAGRRFGPRRGAERPDLRIVPAHDRRAWVAVFGEPGRCID